MPNASAVAKQYSSDVCFYLVEDAYFNVFNRDRLVHDFFFNFFYSVEKALGWSPSGVYHLSDETCYITVNQGKKLWNQLDYLNPGVFKVDENNKEDVLFMNKDISIFSGGLSGVHFLDLSVCFLAFFFYDFLFEVEWFCMFPSIFRFDADVYFTDFFFVFLNFIDSVFFEMLYLDIFWEESILMAIPQQGELDFLVNETAFDTYYVMGETITILNCLMLLIDDMRIMKSILIFEEIILMKSRQMMMMR